MENCRRAIGRLANKLGEQRLSCGKTLDVIWCFVLNSEDGSIMVQSCYITGCWFQTFFIFHNTWDNPSHWLSYFSRWLNILKPPTRSCSSAQNCVWLFKTPPGPAGFFKPTGPWPHPEDPNKGDKGSLRGRGHRIDPRGELTRNSTLVVDNSGVCGFHHVQTAYDQMLGMQGFLAIGVCWVFAVVFLSDVYHSKASVLWQQQRTQPNCWNEHSHHLQT